MKQTEQTKKDISPKEVGWHLRIDFVFVHGSDYVIKENGRLATSIDGYGSYCLIIDKASQYITMILTKTNHPPIQEL